MSIQKFAALAAVLVFAPNPGLQAQTGLDSLSVQGIVIDSTGTEPDTSVSVTFHLYKDDISVWNETQTVEIVDGIMNVVLGRIEPLDTVAFNVPIELGITIGSDAEMSPRTDLTSAPFALGMRGMYAVWNEIGSDRAYSVVQGGPHNSISPTGIGQTIGGGGGRIGGVAGNTVTDSWGTVSGGARNVAGSFGFVGGGRDNSADGLHAVVGGGQLNIAKGVSSTVLGGWRNAARGDYSFAGGRTAKANHDGSFVWHHNGSGSVNDTLGTMTAGQFLIEAPGGVGIGTNRTLQLALTVARRPIAWNSAFFGEAVLIQDSTAVLGVYSATGAASGSALALGEAAPDFVDKWAIFRDAVANGSSLRFTHGTDRDYTKNDTVATLEANGDFTVAGLLSKGGGAFKIDHPLDPLNKYLSHSFVESPDMMNVYNGNVELDSSGGATIELPAYFEALNRDFRYQLTCIGGFAPVYIAEKIQANRFRIAGGEPGMEVSWQVTGIRQDPFAKRHRIEVETSKDERERGSYLHPGAYRD